VSFSYYEIYTTCLRALSAIGFPYGADEDAAFIVSWLELNRLNGLKNLVSLLRKKNRKYNGTLNTKNLFIKNKINIKKSSLLMKGPGLFDLLGQRFIKKNNDQYIIENCIDPIFVIPLAERLCKNNIYLNSYWLEQNFLIEARSSVDNTIIKRSKRISGIKKNQIILELSKKRLLSKLNTKIYSMINKRSTQKRLGEAISPNIKNWKIVSSFADKSFVPESKESRKKGAGGGDDND
tara:strand:+ start:5733 stop:6440 length:708 start_codon:yes stop_codon:yes gene_type:complete